MMTIAFQEKDNDNKGPGGRPVDFLLRIFRFITSKVTAI